MPDFELMFSINHVDDDTVQDIYDRYDALVSRHNELTLLCVSVQGATVLDAASNVVTDLERHTKTRLLWCIEEQWLPGDEELTRDLGKFQLPSPGEVEEINRWLEAHHELHDRGERPA